MEQQGIYARASIACEEISIISTKNVSRLSVFFSTFRKMISDHIDQMVSDSDANGVLKALLIGDRFGIISSLQGAFSRTRTAHLLVISGLHVDLVATLSFLLFRGILYFPTRLN